MIVSTTLTASSAGSSATRSPRSSPQVDRCLVIDTGARDDDARGRAPRGGREAAGARVSLARRLRRGAQLRARRRDRGGRAVGGHRGHRRAAAVRPGYSTCGRRWPRPRRRVLLVQSPRTAATPRSASSACPPASAGPVRRTRRSAGSVPASPRCSRACVSANCRRTRRRCGASSSATWRSLRRHVEAAREGPALALLPRCLAPRPRPVRGGHRRLHGLRRARRLGGGGRLGLLPRGRVLLRARALEGRHRASARGASRSARPPPSCAWLAGFAAYKAKRYEDAIAWSNMALVNGLSRRRGRGLPAGRLSPPAGAVRGALRRAALDLPGARATRRRPSRGVRASTRRRSGRGSRPAPRRRTRNAPRMPDRITHGSSHRWPYPACPAAPGP